MTDYDVIVVGAGSAGSTLAGRLTENPARSVLLIEAGPIYLSNEDYPNEILDGSASAAAFPGHPNNWSFTGQLTNETSTSVPRGKILGGSSALNGLIFIRAPRSDFDRWASFGNDEWSYESVLPFYKRLESDRDFPRHELHGSSGPVPVSRGLESPMHPISDAFEQACLDLGYPFDEDKNSQNSLGVGRAPSNVLDGVRINAAMSYVLPHQGRANLSILGDTFVRRVLVKAGRAIGVEVERNGQPETIRGNEIVLCCGAVKSPHLLLLSGIGPSREIKAQGLDVVQELPGVGKGFSDHPDLNVTYSLGGKVLPRPGTRMTEVMLNFTAQDSPFEGDLEVLSFPRSLLSLARGGAGPMNLARRTRHTISAFRAFSPRLILSQARKRNDYFLANVLQQEESRGDLTIVSPDPHRQPEIAYNYLSTDLDRRRMREVIRTGVRIVESPAFRRLGAVLTGPGSDVTASDRSLDEWARRNVITAIHMSGSAHFGPETDEFAVTDQRCRVYGMHGLRVVDTSVFPTVTSRGTNASVIMAAEKIAAGFDD